MKKVLISLIFIFLLTGCWNYKELNDYSIISGIAIDKIKDKYEVSILISNSPKSSSTSDSTESQIVVYSGKGDTIVHALKDAGLIAPKELYIGSFSILVISEDIAKEGINDVIDFFFRYSNSRKNFDVVISKDDKAKDILKIMTPLSNFPSQNISDNLDSTSKLQGIVAKTDFNEILSKLLRNGTELTINGISVIGDKETGYEQKNLESSEPKSYIKLGPLGIFKDDKLIKWSNYEESLGINIIKSEINEMFFKINDNDDYIVIDTTKFKSSIKVNIKNNKPTIDINLKGKARILETKGNIDLENIKNIENLEKKANKQIKKYVNKAIKLARENNTDIFGFGLKFYQNYPNYYKNNKNKILEKATININSNLMFENKVSAKNSLEAINEKKQNN